LNLGVNIVPPTPSGGLVGHKVIATLYSHKTHLRAMGHYTLTESRSAAQADLVPAPTVPEQSIFSRKVSQTLNNPPSL
jgi:hypothetical protein